MGSGWTQLVVLLVLTVVGLPLFFFGLMAALDGFERRLYPQPQDPPAHPAAAAAPPAATTAVVTAAAVTPAVAATGLAGHVGSERLAQLDVSA